MHCTQQKLRKMNRPYFTFIGTYNFWYILCIRLICLNNVSGFYYIEYWLQNPGESRRHLFSAVGMANNGWYNRLYTVTGQVGLATSFHLLLVLVFGFHISMSWMHITSLQFHPHVFYILMQYLEEESEKFSSKIEKVS